MAALVAVLWIPWTAQLTVVMRRIEGSSPVLTIIQLIGGILTAWVVMFCPAIWAAAAFRSDIDPNLVRTLNDLGFFLFNITYAVTSVQAIAAGLVGLADKSARPVFPRWVSGWAIFTGVSFVPLTAMPFFKTGPLAWKPFRSGPCSEFISSGPPRWAFAWRRTPAGDCAKSVPLKRRASGSRLAPALPPDVLT